MDTKHTIVGAVIAQQLAQAELNKPETRKLIEDLQATFDLYTFPDVPEEDIETRQVESLIMTLAEESLKTFSGLTLPPRAGIEALLWAASDLLKKTKEAILQMKENEDFENAYTMKHSVTFGLRCLCLIMGVHLKLQLLRKDNLEALEQGTWSPTPYLTALSAVLIDRLTKNSVFTTRPKSELRPC